MRVLESGFLESSLKEHADFQNTNRDDHVQSRWDAGGVPEEQPRLPAILPLRARTGSGMGPGGRRRQCQGNRRQARTRGRDPLVHAMRKPLSKYGWNPAARVRTCHDPSSSCVFNKY